MAAGNLAVDPVMQLATIGVLGVGAQWVAWRLRVPAIVLMLGIGLLAWPLLGVLDPKAAIGDLMTPIISIAVTVILFEGGLTLNFHQLRDASLGVTRLVLVGAPLGWITSALALHYVAGVSWAVAAVFGGIMIVTGPTVIAPLLRQAKLSHRPRGAASVGGHCKRPHRRTGGGSTDHRFDRVKRCGCCRRVRYCPSVQTRMGARIHESPCFICCFTWCFCRLNCALARKRTIGRDHHGRLDRECKFALI